MSNTQLAVTGLSDYSISVTPDAIALRQSLLQDASLILDIGDEDDQAIAVESVGKLRRWNKELEAAREEVKRPILDAGNEIQRVAKEAIKDTSSEIKRIEDLLADYHKAQVAKTRAAAEEANRIAEQAQAQADAEAQAERDKIAAIDAEKQRQQELAISARGKRAREAAAAEARRLEEEQTAAELASEFQRPVQAVIPHIPVVTKPEGASVVEVIEIDVVNIKDLYALYPHLCRIEPDLAAIKYHLGTLKQNGRPLTLPGLNVRLETKVRGKAI